MALYFRPSVCCIICPWATMFFTSNKTSTIHSCVGKFYHGHDILKCTINAGTNSSVELNVWKTRTTMFHTLFNSRSHKPVGLFTWYVRTIFRRELSSKCYQGKIILMWGNIGILIFMCFVKWLNHVILTSNRNISFLTHSKN